MQQPGAAPRPEAQESLLVPSEGDIPILAQTSSPNGKAQVMS